MHYSLKLRSIDFYANYVYTNIITIPKYFSTLYVIGKLEPAELKPIAVPGIGIIHRPIQLVCEQRKDEESVFMKKIIAVAVIALMLISMFIPCLGSDSSLTLTASASNENYINYQFAGLPAFEQYTKDELKKICLTGFSSYDAVFTEENLPEGVSSALELTVNGVGQKVISTSRHIQATSNFAETTDNYHYNGRALVSGKTFNGNLNISEYQGIMFWVGGYKDAIRVMLHRGNTGGPDKLADPEGAYGEDGQNDEGAFFILPEIYPDENGYVKFSFSSMHTGWMWWDAGNLKSELPSLDTLEIEFMNQKLSYGTKIYVGDFKLYNETPASEKEKLSAVIEEVEARDDASEKKELLDAAKKALTSGNNSQMLSSKNALMISMKSDILSQLYSNTYTNLLGRVSKRGYAPTSLTGAYNGMFVRDASCQVLMHIANGDYYAARNILYFLYSSFQHLGSSTPYHMISDFNEYSYGNNDGSSLGNLRPLLKFGATSVAEQEISATDSETITAVNVWISKADGANGMVTAELWRDRSLIGTDYVKTSELSSSRTNVTFEFGLPLTPVKSGNYTLKLYASESAAESIVWHGRKNYRGLKTLLDGSTVNGEASFEAFKPTLKYLSDHIQPDAIYHLAYAWTLYANGAPDTEENRKFIEESMPIVLKYANEYLKPSYYNSERNLIKNPFFEHSREGRKWVSYDLLTNVFASQVYYNFSKVAEKLGLNENSAKYMETATALQKGINENFVAEADGKKIYAELYDIEHSDKFILGMSWVNIAPCAVNWFGIDNEIISNTFEYYRKHATLTFGGFSMLDACYDLDRNTSGNHIIGKGFSWELMYYASIGDTDRLSFMTDFLTALSSPKRVFTESWHLPYNFSDVGNQEHASWQAYAMATVFPEIIQSATEKLKDLDKDGKVTVSDALKALQIAVFPRNYYSHEHNSADIDKDGKVTVSDALMILRTAAGLKN